MIVGMKVVHISDHHIHTQHHKTMVEPAHDFLTSLGYVKPDTIEDRLRDFMADRDSVSSRDIMNFCGFTNASQMMTVSSFIEALSYRKGHVRTSTELITVYRKKKDFSVLVPEIMKGKDSITTDDLKEKCGLKSVTQLHKVKNIMKDLGYEKVKLSNGYVYKKKKDFSVLIPKIMKGKDALKISQIMKKCGFTAQSQMQQVVHLIISLGYEKVKLSNGYSYRKKKDFSVLVPEIMKGKDSIPVRQIMNQCGFTSSSQMQQIEKILHDLGYEKKTLKVKNRQAVFYIKKTGKI